MLFLKRWKPFALMNPQAGSTLFILRNPNHWVASLSGACSEVSDPQDTCQNVRSTPTPSNGVTDSDGSFDGPDQFAMCSPSCLPPVSQSNCAPTGSCTVSFTQTWSVAGVDVRVNAVAITCKQVQVTPQ